MSFYDYKASQAIAQNDYPFYALIMAAMRQADSNNAELLKQAWPHVWDELNERYNSPGGLTEVERIAEAAASEQGESTKDS